MQKGLTGVVDEGKRGAAAVTRRDEGYTTLAMLEEEEPKAVKKEKK